MAIDSELLTGMGAVTHLNLVGGTEKTQVDTSLVMPREELVLTREGVETVEGIPDRHHGSTRIARGYQVGSDRKGIEVRNERQISLVTANDLFQVADDMGIIEAIQERGLSIIRFMSVAVAANVVISGYVGNDEAIDEHLGPGTRLYIGTPESGAIINISENHLPCSKPATAIAYNLGLDPSSTRNLYKEVASESRGYMAEVWAPGVIEIDDPVQLQLPINFKGANQAFWSRDQGYQHP